MLAAFFQKGISSIGIQGGTWIHTLSGWLLPASYETQAMELQL